VSSDVKIMKIFKCQMFALFQALVAQEVVFKM